MCSNAKIKRKLNIFSNICEKSFQFNSKVLQRSEDQEKKNNNHLVDFHCTWNVKRKSFVYLRMLRGTDGYFWKYEYQSWP